MLSTPSICWRWNTHVFLHCLWTKQKMQERALHGSIMIKFAEICLHSSKQNSLDELPSTVAKRNRVINVYTFLNLERKILLPGGARVRLVCTNHLYTKCTHQIEFHTFHMQCFLPRIPLTGSLMKVQLVQRKIYLIKAFLPKTVWWCTSVMLTYLFLFLFRTANAQHAYLEMKGPWPGPCLFQVLIETIWIARPSKQTSSQRWQHVSF